MRTRVRRWGNSLAVRIPKSFADHAGFHQNTAVDMALIDDGLVIERAKKLAFTLDDLLAEVTAESVHPEVETGPATGDEVW